MWKVHVFGKDFLHLHWIMDVNEEKHPFVCIQRRADTKKQSRPVAATVFPALYILKDRHWFSGYNQHRIIECQLIKYLRVHRYFSQMGFLKLIKSPWEPQLFGRAYDKELHYRISIFEKLEPFFTGGSADYTHSMIHTHSTNPFRVVWLWTIKREFATLRYSIQSLTSTQTLKSLKINYTYCSCLVQQLQHQSTADTYILMDKAWSTSKKIRNKNYCIIVAGSISL